MTSKARNLSDFISDPTISTAEISNNSVTHGKLHTDVGKNIPTTFGTAGQVLTVNSGATAATFADAGGGADLYTANESSPTAQPSATGTNAIAIGDTAVSTGTDSFAFGKARATGARSFAVHTGTNASYGAISADCIAIGEFARASNSMSVAIGRSASATGSQGVSLGFVATTTGNQATAIQRGLASGENSFAAQITDSTTSYGASGTDSIAMGKQAKATGSTNGSIAIGNDSQAASREAVAIGSSAFADGSGSVALGGYFGTSVQARALGTASFAVAGYNGLASIDSTATGLGSIALGGGHADQTQSKAFGAMAHSNVRGKVAWSAYTLSTDYGSTQAGNYVLMNTTTDATATVLVTDHEYATPSTINQVVLSTYSCYGFTGTVIARERSTDTDDFAVWEIKGGAVRENNASTTALGSYNINKISESSGATNWSIALSADTTNGAVAITVTGEASHNIRWVATVNTTEVRHP